MSENHSQNRAPAAGRGPAGGRGPMGGGRGPMGGGGMMGPVEKPKSFKGTMKNKLYPVKRTRERVTFEPTSPVYGR